MKILTTLLFFIFCNGCLFADALFSNSKIVPKLQSSISDSIIKMQDPGDIKIFPINCNWIMISRIPKWSYYLNFFPTPPADPAKVENPKSFLLIDNITDEKIPLLKSGLKRRVLYAPNPARKKDLRICEKYFIQTSKPLKNKHSYTLIINATIADRKIKKKFSFSPETSISQIIHIDPYGFRSTDPKKVFLGLNMGSAGEIIPDILYSVINLKTKKIVYSGNAVKQTYSGWPVNLKNKPYSNVYVGNFSHITTPGEYIIKHSSGYSLPFTISDDAYRITLNTLALGMYHQRRGEDLLEKYTRFARKATIEDNTFIYNSDNMDKWLTSLFNKLPKNKRKIKYGTTLEGKKVSFSSAGHMDAGDYSPYTYNSSLLVYNFITTLDLFKNDVFHDNLGLPESGDGIPDLLQEMVFELNWLKGMQDPTDGGVFSMIKPFGHSYQNTMPGKNKNITRYLVPKDTTVTAAYTAALARAARSPVLKKYYPKLINELTNKAIKSWNWLEKNHGYQGFHHYGRENGDLDERAWAAIELYALTGKQKYHKVFEQLHRPLKRANGVEWMNNSYGNVNRTLALWDFNNIDFPVNPSLKVKSVQRFYDYLNFCVENSKNMPYNLVFNNVYKRFYMIGWFFPVSAYSWDLLLGYKLYGNRKFLETALDQIHYTLGANPLNKTFITGLGYNRLHEIVDQKSLYDNIEEPVSGIPVSPVVTGYTYQHPYGNQLTTLTYPQSRFNTNIPNWEKTPWILYGILELPYDGWNLKAEMTIEKLGTMLSCMAIITPVEKQQFDYPKFDLYVKKIGANIFKPIVQFKKAIQDKYYFMWFINGMPVSANPNFTFKANGSKKTYNIGLEIITDKGRRFYNETKIENIYSFLLFSDGYPFTRPSNP
jgi:hypothetical protein